jgi:hypothetical protein
MDGLGQLAHVKGGAALAYRKGGHALVFKGSPRPITIRVPWGPQNYVCSTYSMYHELTMTVSGGWLSGAGEIIEEIRGGTETVFKIKATDLPAQFFVMCSGLSPCAAATEDPPEVPDMYFEATATQRGAEPAESGRVSGVCMTSKSVVFGIDETGALAGVEVA